jgi:hypothetical protein
LEFCFIAASYSSLHSSSIKVVIILSFASNSLSGKLKKKTKMSEPNVKKKQAKCCKKEKRDVDLISCYGLCITLNINNPLRICPN